MTIDANAMPDSDDFNVMTDAVIKAAEQVMRTGSPELQAAMRVLLYILATETAEQIGARPERMQKWSSGV